VAAHGRRPAYHAIQTATARPLNGPRKRGSFLCGANIRRMVAFIAGQESLDFAVHAGEGFSLILAASVIASYDLVLDGTLIDPDIPARVDTSIHVGWDQSLAEGRHIERTTEFTIDSEHETSTVRWIVETTDLGDGYRLHDARVNGDFGDMRAFAIEDLVWTLGVGLAAALTAACIWKSRKKDAEGAAQLKRLCEDCKEGGGTPWVTYGGTETVAMGADGKLNFKSGLAYTFRCET
jgi:hypothetical protein